MRNKFKIGFVRITCLGLSELWLHNTWLNGDSVDHLSCHFANGSAFTKCVGGNTYKKFRNVCAIAATMLVEDIFCGEE